MKPPKLRKPRAKPQKAHKSKKDKPIGQVELLVCSKCGGQFFMVMKKDNNDLCMGCYNGN